MADTSTPSPEKSGILSKVLKVLAAPIAAVSGLWATKVVTYNSAYENAAKQGLMWVKADADAEIAKIVEMAEKKGIPLEKKDGFVKLVGKDGLRTAGMQPIVLEAIHTVTHGKTYEVTAKSVPYHAEMDKRVYQHMKDIGLGTLRKQWIFMRGDQQQRAIIEGLTIAGIAFAGLGAVISLIGKKTVSHALSTQDAAQKSEQGPSV